MKPFNWINKKLDQWLFKSFRISPEGLALYRICFAGYFLIFGVPTYTWISENPEAFFNPPSLSFAALFNGFPNYAALQVLSTLICVLFILLLFGFKTRMTSIVLAITLIVANSFRYSFGKIDHDIIPIVTLFLMSFSGWGARFSIDSFSKQDEDRSETEGWPIAWVAFILAFGFFSAGLPKLVGWIDFDITTHGVRSWVMRAFYVDAQQDLLVPYAVEFTNPYFWECLDILAVMFELGFIVALVAPSWFRAYVCIAVIFHFNNLMILNIPFTKHIVVYLLFLNWETVISFLRRKRVWGLAYNFFTIRHMLVFALLYLPFYYLAQGIRSMPAALNASPLSLIIEDWVGWNYHIVSSTFVLSLAVIVVLWVTILKTIKIFRTYALRVRSEYRELS